MLTLINRTPQSDQKFKKINNETRLKKKRERQGWLFYFGGARAVIGLRTGWFRSQTATIIASNYAAKRKDSWHWKINMDSMMSFEKKMWIKKKQQKNGNALQRTAGRITHDFECQDQHLLTLTRALTAIAEFSPCRIYSHTQFTAFTWLVSDTYFF